MSLPHGGSTAPTITSPLLAWPSLPKSRSPLSTPSTSTTFIDSSIPSIYSRQHLSSSRSLASSLTRSDSLDTDRKGKGKEVTLDHGDVFVQISPEPQYGPPKQPLTPHQLSRIAQSFGIIVPCLPTPSPSASPIAGPSRLRAEPPQRQSPYLLTVIPPSCLLNMTDIPTDEAKKRNSQWKRGRLIPLQPTLGGMLVAIAREFGLPSTTGLQVYMGNGNGASGGSSVTDEEPAGPRVSAQTWSTLFGAHLQNTVTSRGSSPSHTPIKFSGPLARDVAYPLTPLSLVEKKAELARRGPRDRINLHSTGPPLSAPTARTGPETRFLSTPPMTAIPTGPIIGTIEFDLDMDLAIWFEEYKRAGRYRKSSTSSDSGIRPLRLAQSTTSPVLTGRSRPQMLRDSDGFGSGDTTLNDHETSDDFGKDFPPIRSKETGGRRLSVKETGQGVMMSTAGSFGEFPSEGDDSFVSTRNSSERGWGVPEIMLHERAESGEKTHAYEGLQEELLASPIELGGETLSPVSPRVVEGDDKRGSAMVMSEQLDDLEKIMRQLSPRDIRLTSPRMLTPRMAAKVATSKLQFPFDPSSRPIRATSSLARPSTHSASSSSSSLSSAAPIPDIEKSTLTVNTYATQSSVPSFDATTLSRPPLEAEYSDAGLPRPTWPAVPFAKLGDSPGSPGSIHDYFRQPTPDSPISTETLSRMRMSPPMTVQNEAGTKAPRRPNRPPSPDLSDPSIPPYQRQYSLSPELLRSPGGPSSPGAPPTPDKGPRLKSRSGSMSLKGLKHMSSRNFGWKRGENEKPPALPLANKTGMEQGGSGDKEERTAMGLFGSGEGDKDGVRVSPQASTFPGLGDGQATEFGQNDGGFQGVSRTGSVPSKTKESGGFSRWNLFGSRKGNANTTTPGSTADKEKDKNRSSTKSSKRNPSIDHKTIGPPISGTFQRNQQPIGHAQSASISSIRSASISHSQSRPSLPGMSSSATTHTLISEPAEEPTSPSIRGYSSSHGHGHGYGYGTEMSPRGVKRKPVPLPLGQGGMKTSESIGSMVDVSDKRVNRGTWMGIPIGEPVVGDIAAAAAAAAVSASPEKVMKKSGSMKSLGKKGKGEVSTPPRIVRRGTEESDDKPTVPQGRGVWMGVRVG